MLTSATSILKSAAAMQGWNKSSQLQLLLDFIEFSNDNPTDRMREGGLLKSLFLFLDRQREVENEIEVKNDVQGSVNQVVSLVDPSMTQDA